ncbi:hypothetical protein GCM10009547_35990 [Sporichthya brevicatena]|uniref:M23ase beta-sheet core domain-containing protein n=2 Tax=Sporichthya brevicatena TaxID=171442 RepID=A0ABP3SCF1_9ACTN
MGTGEDMVRILVAIGVAFAMTWAGGTTAAGSVASPSPSYVFPIQDCDASYGRVHHDYPASDVFAREGCPIVSVTDGVVDEVSRRDRWNPRRNDGATRGGLSVSIIGDDGVRYYYSHLSVINRRIEPGERVTAGRRLGQVGRTGSARGTSPHVHFGLSWPTPHRAWWVRRGMLAPAPYLDAWRDGKDRSPARAIRELRDDRGEIPPCDAAC